MKLELIPPEAVISLPIKLFTDAFPPIVSVEVPLPDIFPRRVTLPTV